MKSNTDKHFKDSVILQKYSPKPGLMVHGCDPNTWEVEVGASAVQGRPQLSIEFQASLGFVRSCLKITVNQASEITQPLKVSTTKPAELSATLGKGVL